MYILEIVSIYFILSYTLNIMIIHILLYIMYMPLYMSAIYFIFSYTIFFLFYIKTLLQLMFQFRRILNF